VVALFPREIAEEGPVLRTAIGITKGRLEASPALEARIAPATGLLVGRMEMSFLLRFGLGAGIQKECGEETLMMKQFLRKEEKERRKAEKD